MNEFKPTRRSFLVGALAVGGSLVVGTHAMAAAKSDPWSADAAAGSADSAADIGRPGSQTALRVASHPATGSTTSIREGSAPGSGPAGRSVGGS